MKKQNFNLILENFLTGKTPSKKEIELSIKVEALAKKHFIMAMRAKII